MFRGGKRREELSGKEQEEGKLSSVSILGKGHSIQKKSFLGNKRLGERTQMGRRRREEGKTVLGKPYD